MGTAGPSRKLCLGFRGPLEIVWGSMAGAQNAIKRFHIFMEPNVRVLWPSQNSVGVNGGRPTFEFAMFAGFHVHQCTHGNVHARMNVCTYV